MTCNLCKSNEHIPIFTKKGYDIHKCTKCGFIFVHPIPTQEILQEYYDTSYESGGYKIYATAQDIRFQINEARFKDLSKYFIKGNILDIGSGAGHFLDVAAKNGLRTYGVEFSEDGVKKAKINHENIYKGFLEQIGFENSFFDNITIFDVIEHVVDPLGTVREISRIIKNGGILALTTPDISSWHAKLFGKRWGLIIPPEHLSYFSLSVLKTVLEENGFTVLEIRKNYKIFTLEYLLRHTENFFPRVYPLAKILLRMLPKNYLKKYRKFFIGEMFVVAQKK